jgi:hypothetical protein
MTPNLGAQTDWGAIAVKINIGRTQHPLGGPVNVIHNKGTNFGVMIRILEFKVDRPVAISH